MKKKTPFAVTVLISLMLASCTSSEVANFDAASAEREIRAVLAAQESAWNEGNISEFMNGYWKSDSLRFIGKGITTGWQATLDRYLATYPDRAAMGQLTFEFYRFHFIDGRTCLITGRYRLKREADEPTGMFTLLIKQVDTNWVIVYDHTS